MLTVRMYSSVEIIMLTIPLNLINQTKLLLLRVNNNVGFPFHTGNPGFYPVVSNFGALDIFQELVEKDLVKLTRDLRLSTREYNLFKAECLAIKQLGITDSVIRGKDKGSAIVLLIAGLFCKLNEELLRDTTTYHKLSCVPLPTKE